MDDLFGIDPFGDEPPPPTPRPRKPLGQRQVQDFLEAADERPSKDESNDPADGPSLWGEKGRRKFLSHMKIMYPLRTRRLLKDVEWFRVHAAKNGLDPAEVRWLL